MEGGRRGGEREGGRGGREEEKKRGGEEGERRERGREGEREGGRENDHHHNFGAHTCTLYENTIR